MNILRSIKNRLVNSEYGKQNQKVTGSNTKRPNIIKKLERANVGSVIPAGKRILNKAAGKMFFGK